MGMYVGYGHLERLSLEKENPDSNPGPVGKKNACLWGCF